MSQRERNLIDVINWRVGKSIWTSSEWVTSVVSCQQQVRHRPVTPSGRPAGGHQADGRTDGQLASYVTVHLPRLVRRPLREQIKPARPCVRACACVCVCVRSTGQWPSAREDSDQARPPAILLPHPTSPSWPTPLRHVLAKKFLAGDRACQLRMRARARVHEYVNRPPPGSIYSGRHRGTDDAVYWTRWYSEKMNDSHSNLLLKAEHRKVK